MFACKVPAIFVGFSWNLNFLDRFSKKTQVSSLIKIRPVGVELFHADLETGGWTDRYDEASSRFSQFCEQP